MSMACHFRTITDRSSLEGTAYVEVMAGAYAVELERGSLFFAKFP